MRIEDLRVNEDDNKFENSEEVAEVEKDEFEDEDTSSDESIRDPFDPSEIRVITRNTQIAQLISRMENNELELQPDFQRSDSVWTMKTKSRLIESMIIRIPLPAFYFDATDDDKWLVIDGLQRLTTIKEFVIEKKWALRGLEFLKELEGKRFDELTRNYKRRIMETDIVMYQIQPGTPPEVKFAIFSRINTGGSPLNPQEIRHALNQGKITKSLKEMADSDTFKIATGQGISSKRMHDRESVLRYYAFMMQDPQNYEEDSYDQFLNKTMRKCNDMSDTELNELETKFIEAMKISYSIFGEHTFRKISSYQQGRNRINKALFEVWSVNISQLNSDQKKEIVNKKDIVIERFKSLLKDDDDFDNSISQSTGSISKVKCRFSKIKKLIHEVLQ